MTPNDLDQALAGMRDSVPRVWWAVYQGSLNVGFDPKQAFACLQTYILSQGSAPIRPSDDVGQPKPE